MFTSVHCLPGSPLHLSGGDSCSDMFLLGLNVFVSLQSLTPGFQSNSCRGHWHLQSMWPCVGSHLWRLREPGNCAPQDGPRGQSPCCLPSCSAVSDLIPWPTKPLREPPAHSASRVPRSLTHPVFLSRFLHGHDLSKPDWPHLLSSTLDTSTQHVFPIRPVLSCRETGNHW